MTLFARDTATSAPAGTSAEPAAGAAFAAGAASGPGTASAECALADFFARGAQHADTAEHRDLWAALTEVADGGKGLRPALFQSVYRALGGTQEQVAAQVGAALELLHTALVIHDDVIDGDTVRRGRPNVSGTFAAQARARGHDPHRAAHYGESAAILAGDLAMAGAVRTLATCGAAQPVVAQMLDLLDRTLHLSAAGELADVRLSMDSAADISAAITMEHHKTAVYSFELPLLLAVVLADAGAQYGVLSEFARLVGVAYQLRDDLDGMFGAEQAIGKSVLSDLREGKCTPLIAHARTTVYWPQIRPHLGVENIDVHTAAEVRVLLERSGSRAYVQDLAADLAHRARRTVAHLPIANLLDEWVYLVADRGDV